MIIEILTAISTVVQAIGALALALQGLKVIANAIVNFAKALGLIEDDMKPEDLGDKAIQSGYNPEDFDTYEAYVEAVKEFKVDPEKSKEISTEDKYNKAIELSVGLAQERCGPEVGDFIKATAIDNRDVFGPKEMSELVKIVKQDDNFLKNCTDVLTGVVKSGGVFDSVLKSLDGIGIGKTKIDPIINMAIK